MNKNVVRGVIISIILLIILGIYTQKQNNKVDESYVIEVNRNLTEEQKQIYITRLDEASSKLGGDLTNEDRQKWMLQKGMQLYGLGKLAESEAVFEEAKNLKAEELMSYTLLYQVQLERGKNDDALKNIQEAVKIRPDSADLWKKYIVIEKDIFHVDKDTIDATYAEALVKTNYSIDIVTAYASWLKEVGELQKSKEYWQMAIEINPNNKAIYESEINSI